MNIENIVLFDSLLWKKDTVLSTSSDVKTDLIKYFN